MQPTEPANPNDTTDPKVVPAANEPDIALSPDSAVPQPSPVAPQATETAQNVPIEPGPVVIPAVVQSAKPKSKKLLIVLLVLLALVGAGAAVWVLLIKKDETAVAPGSNTSSSPDTVANAPEAGADQMNSLIYAYKEGKKVTVRSIKLSDKSKTDLFSFNEEYDTNQISFSNGLSQPNVDLNSEGSFAYIANDGLYIGKNGSIAQKVKRTVVSADLTQASYEPEFEVPTPREGPGGPYVFFNPRWAPDNTSIAFATGYMEGGGIGKYTLATNKLSILGNTFTYITPSYDGKSPLKLSGSTDLLSLNYGEPYFFKLNGVIADFLPEGKVAAAVLCQSVEQEYDFSDCTKYPHKLASIDTGSGEVSVLGEGSFDTVTAVSADKWYVMSMSGGTKAISEFVPSTKAITTIDLSTALKDQGEILYARVIVGSPVLAEVYSKKSSGYTVSVINLADQQLLASFDIADSSAFKVLGTE